MAVATKKEALAAAVTAAAADIEKAAAVTAVAADIANYAGTDLVCYRAAEPDELVEAQAAAWNPVLGWAHETLGARLAPRDA